MRVLLLYHNLNSWPLTDQKYPNQSPSEGLIRNFLGCFFLERQGVGGGGNSHWLWAVVCFNYFCLFSVYVEASLRGNVSFIYTPTTFVLCLSKISTPSRQMFHSFKPNLLCFIYANLYWKNMHWTLRCVTITVS